MSAMSEMALKYEQIEEENATLSKALNQALSREERLRVKLREAEEAIKNWQELGLELPK